MRICAIIPFYNDFTGGERLYWHLHKHGIYSIWADGRFHNFKQINNSDLSTDELPAFLKLQPDTDVLDVGLCWMHDKLNRLFERVTSMCYDYCFLFGCDEYPIGDFTILLQNLKMYDIGKPCHYRVDIDERNPLDKTNKDQGIERIFYKPEHYTVDISHWHYQVNGKRQHSFIKIIDGVTVVHDDKIRSEERNKMMNDYQSINVPIERSKFMNIMREEAVWKRKMVFQK